MPHEYVKRRGPMAAAITDAAVVVGDGPTWTLRHSDFPLWREIRERLAADGIDPATAVLADSYELAPAESGPAIAEVGVVVANDRRVLRYRKSYETNTWDDWTDVTARWELDEHAEAIQRALSQLGRA